MCFGSCKQPTRLHLKFSFKKGDFRDCCLGWSEDIGSNALPASTDEKDHKEPTGVTRITARSAKDVYDLGPLKQF
jgi:hypothetical protein